MLTLIINSHHFNSLLQNKLTQLNSYMVFSFKLLLRSSNYLPSTVTNFPRVNGDDWSDRSTRKSLQYPAGHHTLIWYAIGPKPRDRCRKFAVIFFAPKIKCGLNMTQMKQEVTRLLRTKGTLKNKRKIVLWMQARGLLRHHMLCRCNNLMHLIKVSRHDGYLW